MKLMKRIKRVLIRLSVLWLGFGDIDDPKDNQESRKLRTWDQSLFIYFRSPFIFVLAFIISLFIFGAINLAGPGESAGLGFIIVYAAMLECIIAIPLILSIVVIYFRTAKGEFFEKIKFKSKREYLLPIGIASILGLMATL